MRRLGLVLLIVGFFACLILGSGAFYLANSLAFFGRPERDWKRPVTTECTNEWQKSFLEEKTKQPLSLDWSCSQALSARFKKTMIKSDRHNLSFGLYDYSENKPTRADVLYVPGMNGNRLEGLRYKPLLDELGIGLKILELPDQGESEHSGRGFQWGCFEQDDILKVLRGFLDAVPNRSEHAFLPKPLYFMGSSYGSTALLGIVATQPELLKQLNVVGVVSETPMESVSSVLSLKDASVLKNGIVNLSLNMLRRKVGANVHECSLEKNLPKITMPLLVLTSLKDTIVTPQSNDLLKQSSRGLGTKFYAFEEGVHSRLWNSNPKIFVTLIRSFFDSHLNLDLAKKETFVKPH